MDSKVEYSTLYMDGHEESTDTETERNVSMNIEIVDVANDAINVTDSYRQFETSEQLDRDLSNISVSSIVTDLVSLIEMEHCYARPHNWRPETNFLRPTKTLFIPQKSTKKKSTNPLAPLQETEDIVDVIAEPIEPPTIYDYEKAKQLMSECERHATCARIDQNNEDWEESISKINWNHSQNLIFNGMVNILNSDYMSRLAYNGSSNEAVLRRTVIDKSVKRFRHLMASISWDSKLTQWLHSLLLENLDRAYLAVYLDILQTLKAKLPTFVDKMLYSSTSSRGGILSNENLYPLLKRPWDPVASSLNQDKPKKLPGNPIIIVVPTSSNSPNHMKRQNKWLNLLTNLGTVHSVYSNIGQSSYRLTIMNCMDQMLAATRAKIQEVKADHPGRPIVLAGFNAGAALALQVAHIESVLCVLCLGFSLLTAEGKRGDPDDNLLELQCPVLFVIGQCSHTSLQEDLEDLRERMRVETGLIVVGAADDYLRVSKKKKRSEGITQSVVDRCIVDEVGEFVSGLLLSPYPPQIRQSPTHVPPDVFKRIKCDRRRNNSNCSSIDSEPPSPTPRITRPGQLQNSSPSFGRPPGSKSKSKLDTKWAQQVAQGTPPSPSPSSYSPPPTPTSANSDTLNDNSNMSSPSIEIIKSNKATINTDIKNKSPSNSSTPIVTSAKLQAMGLGNRSVMHSNPLSSFMQTGPRTLSANPPQKLNTGIKVLENLTLNSNSTAKLVSSTGRTIDLSKITVLNNLNPQKSTNSYGNVILMPDGKLKTASSVKGLGSTPLLLPPMNKAKSPPPINSATQSRITKYITSKKQLLGNKPPKPYKKVPYLPTNLPPPTNLTSQDIMDLPIIFADDNQMLSNTNIMQPSDTPAPQIITQSQPIKTTTPGKYVFVNKQISMANPSGQTLKRPMATNQTIKPPLSNAVKYAKIILSKRTPNDDSKSTSQNIITKISNLSSEVPIKKVEPPALENIDLENELVATAVPKPNFNKNEMKNVTLIYKKSSDICKAETIQKSLTINEITMKRTNTQAEIEENEDDPDYIPSKCMKLE